jgi:hypothetical protein
MELMMKHIILTLLLFFELANSDEELSAEEQSVQMMSQWQTGLYHQLLKHEDPELRAYGVFFLATMDMNQLISEQNEQLLKPVVDEIIHNPDSNHHALWLITEICLDSRMLPDCDIDALFAAQENRHGDRMLSYLYQLNQAMNAGIEGEVIDWIERMSQSREYGFSMEYSFAFDDALNAYSKAVPIPPDMLNRELEFMVDMADMTADEIIFFNENKEHYELAYQKILHDLRMSFPAFKPIIEACETHQELHEACHSIGQKMTNGGGDYISLVIGYKLQSIALNHIGLVKRAELAVDKVNAVKAEIECLRGLVNYPHLPKMDIVLLNENMLVKRGQGERAAMFHWAKQKHKQAVDSGDEQATSLNPELCRYDQGS